MRRTVAGGGRRRVGPMSQMGEVSHHMITTRSARPSHRERPFVVFCLPTTTIPSPSPHFRIIDLMSSQQFSAFFPGFTSQHDSHNSQNGSSSSASPGLGSNSPFQFPGPGSHAFNPNTHTLQNTPFSLGPSFNGFMAPDLTSASTIPAPFDHQNAFGAFQAMAAMMPAVSVRVPCISHQISNIAQVFTTENMARFMGTSASTPVLPPSPSPFHRPSGIARWSMNNECVFSGGYMRIYPTYIAFILALILCIHHPPASAMWKRPSTTRRTFQRCALAYLDLLCGDLIRLPNRSAGGTRMIG